MHKKQRQVEFEVLRIIAMLMIVGLHYLSKTGLLINPRAEVMTVNGYLAWFIEAFCVIAVNIYVLISGYFGINHTTANSWKRVYGVWIKVFFYSVFAGIIFSCLGCLNIGEFDKPDIYKIFGYIFPIVTEHYWFATSYIILCFFMPFINLGFEKLEKREIQTILGLMLVVFCVSKTIIPMQLPWDKYGYDAFWFVVMYMTGGYISKYGINLVNTRLKACLIYVFSQLLVFISFVILRQIYLRTGMFPDMISYGYSYNFIFAYTGAVGLFCLVKLIADNRQANNKTFKNGELIIKISGATFGVYLIHEHIDMRPLWKKIVDVNKIAEGSVVAFIVNMVVVVLGVYVICTLIELLRQMVVHKFEEIRAKQ